jgi:hypothetical protein
MDDSGQSHDLCGNCLMGLFGLMAHNRKLFATGWDLMCFRELPNFSSFLFQNPYAFANFLCIAPSVRVLCYLIDYCVCDRQV